MIVTATDSTNTYTPNYTKDLDVVTEMVNNLTTEVLKLDHVSMFGPAISSEEDPINGWEAGQPYIVIGIGNHDETIVKTYLTGKGILKKEGVNYWDWEYNGITYPVVVQKNTVFRTLPKILPRRQSPFDCVVL